MKKYSLLGELELPTIRMIGSPNYDAESEEDAIRQAERAGWENLEVIAVDYKSV